MLVDSHCHLHLLEQNADTDGALAAARKAGVGHFLNVAVDVESRDALLALSDRYRDVSTSLGVHPSGTGMDPDTDTLAALCEDRRFVAVGETGLDYVYNRGDLGWQRDRFRRHVRAARALGKPVIIHTRGAPEDTVRILREEKAHEVGGVIHCFTEDLETARACIDLGFVISLSGILTFRNADALRQTAAALPLDTLLVETDCPYLAPVPHRGNENQPAWVGRVAECLAEIRDESLDEIVSATGDNFFRTFPLARAAQTSA
jgi:TatD DNase family protein